MRLYWSEHYSLEDAITEMLVEETTGRKMGEETGLVPLPRPRYGTEGSRFMGNFVESQITKGRPSRQPIS